MKNNNNNNITILNNIVTNNKNSLLQIKSDPNIQNFLSQDTLCKSKFDTVAKDIENILDTGITFISDKEITNNNQVKTISILARDLNNSATSVMNAFTELNTKTETDKVNFFTNSCLKKLEDFKYYSLKMNNNLKENFPDDFEMDISDNDDFGSLD